MSLDENHSFLQGVLEFLANGAKVIVGLLHGSGVHLKGYMLVLFECSNYVRWITSANTERRSRRLVEDCHASEMPDEGV